MAQNPDFYKKFPLGMGKFEVGQNMGAPEEPVEPETKHFRALSENMIRSVGGIGIGPRHDALLSRPGVVIEGESDLVGSESALHSIDSATLIGLAGLAIYSPDFVVGHETSLSPGHGMIEGIDDEAISSLGGTMSSPDTAQFN